MRVKFLQAVHLKGKDGKGKDYPRGTHEVPEAHLACKHFHNLVKAGLVEDGEAVKTVASVPLHVRQANIAAKLAADGQKKLEASKAAPAAKEAPQPPSKEPSESAGDEGGDVTPESPPADDRAPDSDFEAPADKSEEDLLAEMEAEEAAKQAEKSKAESSKKSKHKK